MGKDDENQVDEVAAELNEDDAVFENLAAHHSEHGNLDNVPEKELSQTDSDSAEGESDGESDREDETQERSPLPHEEAAEHRTEEKSERSDDIWAEASEAQRREFEKLAHSERSNRGRVSALTRQIEQLQSQVQALQAKPQGKDESKPSDGFEGDFKQFADDYPEIADMFRKMDQRNQQLTQQLSQQVQGVSQAVTPIVQQHRQARQKQEVDKLLQVHPDAIELAASDDFRSWIVTQPPAVRQMFDSDSSEDNITLMDRYKRSAGIQSPVPKNDEPEGKKVEDQLSAMESVPVNRGGPRARSRTELADDFDKAFDQMADKFEKTGTF